MIRAPLTGCVSPLVSSQTANAGSTSWPSSRLCGAWAIWIFTPSPVPLCDCFRDPSGHVLMEVAAVDVDINELTDDVASQPTAFLITTVECMKAIANT